MTDLQLFIREFLFTRIVTLARSHEISVLPKEEQRAKIAEALGAPGSEQDKALRREAFDEYCRERGLDPRKVERAYVRILAQEDQEEAAKRDAGGAA